jgi:hypothetical protein
MTKQEDIWSCTECNQQQGRHDQFFDGVCESCNTQAELTSKKSEVDSILIDTFDRIGCQTPSNYDDILQFVFDDVCETADPVNWNNDDVAIAFRRWIEAQGENKCKCN